MNRKQVLSELNNIDGSSVQALLMLLAFVRSCGYGDVVDAFNKAVIKKEKPIENDPRADLDESQDENVLLEDDSGYEN